ncbi:MAG: hypothetical protein QOJ47_568, partial [Gaiellales bacterium]|nr:hypothetical protein [Gaiellales bacterium]
MDSVLLGGALALTGEMQRRVAEIDRRVAERRVRERREELANAPTPPPAASPSIPGMPLPTGYGLQVRGPMGESIVLPVCLPPGFELDSMMLSPEFLPRVEASAAVASRARVQSPEAAPSFAGTPTRPAAPAHPAAPARPAAAPARAARPEAQPSAGRL